MSTPIQFKGQQYASVEDMPPAIRKIYEKAQAAANLKAKLNADEAVGHMATGQAQHPWDVNAGSGAIAVPAGFEGVTGLGQTEQVYLAQPSELGVLIGVLILGLAFLMPGLFLLVAPIFTSMFKDPPWVAGLIFTLIGSLLVGLSVWSMWSNRVGIHAVVVYHDGFAFEQGGSVQTWQWPEIATIFSNETFHMSKRGAQWTDREYTLSRNNGEKVVLTSYQLANVRGLISVIKRRALPEMLPPLQQAYQAGQPVTFGPVTVSREGGIEVGGKNVAWSDVVKVEVKSGDLLVTMQKRGVLSGHHSVRASTIPNIEALCQIMGLDPWMIDLTHV